MNHQTAAALKAIQNTVEWATYDEEKGVFLVDAHYMNQLRAQVDDVDMAHALRQHPDLLEGTPDPSDHDVDETADPSGGGRHRVELRIGRFRRIAAAAQEVRAAKAATTRRYEEHAEALENEKSLSNTLDDLLAARANR